MIESYKVEMVLFVIFFLWCMSVFWALMKRPIESTICNTSGWICFVLYLCLSN
jgi:hypothetical protein